MNLTESALEYELIDIDFSIQYEQFEDGSSFVCEEDPSDAHIHEESNPIEYDADGIPIGQTMEEIRLRESLISDFLHKWGNDHPARKILNDALEEYIYVKGVSFIETKEHSAKSYNSTRAIMILEEVLVNAKPVKRVPVKIDDKNQRDFEYLLIMLYKHPDIGSVKLTVGVKRHDAMKVQYGISALKSDQPLVDYSVFKRRKKKRSSKK